MRLRRLPLCLALSLPALSLPMTATADEIRMINGDRITGRIVSKADNELVVDTDYAGQIKLRWDQVSSLFTEDTMAVQTRDGSFMPDARLGSTGGDRIELSSEDGRTVVQRQDIVFINPTPEQSGRGVSYSGRANVSAAIVNGNSDNERLYGDASLLARAKTYGWGLGMKVDKREDRGVSTARQWLFDGNYDHFLDDRHFIYGRASLQQDKFKDIRLRTTTGAGYGWQLYDDETTKLSLRSGLDYVRLDREAGMDEDYPALGWGVRASRWIMNRSAELFHDQDGFLSLSDPDFLTLRTKSGVRLPIAGGITASAQLNADWERTPAPGRKATDTTLLLGLGYLW
ncbi:DUF481 domain-containing protein [Methyloversatilis thermotolerans]|uniref:DUF481 domain-containing protein n=1 Tax=Methyloversatilis thermotolerans TaxID=1346290 RepID=UPI0003A3C2B6|nr:DUF481 domain-containing protein [Methyloversatilis thermotolerans]